MFQAGGGVEGGDNYLLVFLSTGEQFLLRTTHHKAWTVSNMGLFFFLIKDWTPNFLAKNNQISP